MISICLILHQLRVQASTCNREDAGVFHVCYLLDHWLYLGYKEWNQTCDLEQASAGYRKVTPAQYSKGYMLYALSQTVQ